MDRLRRLASPAAALVVASLAACVGEGRFSEAQTRALCERALACGDYVELDTCLEVRASQTATLDALIDAGRIAYDAGAGARCLRALRGLECARGEDLAGALAECDAALVGQVALGAACLIDQECAGGAARCELAPGCGAGDACCVGACVGLAAPLAVGEPCSDAPEACMEGSFCSVAGGPDRVCVAIPADGEACPDGVCGAGSFCDGDRCQPAGEVGAACEEDDECAWPALCAVDEFSSLAGACAERAEEGEECDAELGDEGCLLARDRCSEDERCVALGAPGDPCEDDDACLPLAVCLEGACVERLRPGAPCFELSAPVGDGIPCYPGLACLDGACALPQGAGACPLP